MYEPYIYHPDGTDSCCHWLLVQVIHYIFGFVIAAILYFSLPPLASDSIEIIFYLLLGSMVIISPLMYCICWKPDADC